MFLEYKTVRIEFLEVFLDCSSNVLNICIIKQPRGVWRWGWSDWWSAAHAQSNTPMHSVRVYFHIAWITMHFSQEIISKLLEVVNLFSPPYPFTASDGHILYALRQSKGLPNFPLCNCAAQLMDDWIWRKCLKTCGGGLPIIFCPAFSFAWGWQQQGT